MGDRIRGGAARRRGDLTLLVLASGVVTLAVRAMASMAKAVESTTRVHETIIGVAPEREAPETTEAPRAPVFPLRAAPTMTEAPTDPEAPMPWEDPSLFGRFDQGGTPGGTLPPADEPPSLGTV